MEYQFLPENLPAILRGFAIIGTAACVVLFLACVVVFFLVFVHEAATKPRKKTKK